MYLKQLTIKNYRKYDDSEDNVIRFAHSNWKDEKGLEKDTEKYISESSSLLIGENNSGKSTIVNLLDTLQRVKAGSKNVFKYSDFNLSYLRKWYEDKILNKDCNYFEKNNISPSSLPLIEFDLKVGIDSQDDYISNFQDVLVISGLTKDSGKKDEVADIDIVARYEVTNVQQFINKIIEIKQNDKDINIKKLGLDRSELFIKSKTGASEPYNSENVSLSKLEKLETKSPEDEKRLTAIKEYYEEKNYRIFLSLLDGRYYTLNFYPISNIKPAKYFSLSSLLKVKTIQANTVKDNNTLSKAYNKIVSTYVERNDLSKANIDEFIDDINIQLKGEIDSNIKGVLQETANKIESSKELKMNLQPDITLEKILGNSILYEYQEDENLIPENQYGMGYTNLMVIIAEIVDYFETYEEEDTNGAINILCIEEPETFMHPEMQELFIKNISKAISNLMPKNKNIKKDTFQIIITTHSSHILNSKIQSGNTLNNIVYLSKKEIKNINDSTIINNIVKNTNKEENAKIIFEYIKKYLRLELADIFFAEAIIIVEGQTEETYLRYLIDSDDKLNKHHIKVYRIDGAYGYKFIPLLEMLNIKTIIITDLDINRSQIDDDTSPATNLDKYSNSDKQYLTTNQTLIKAICKEESIDKKDVININSKIKTKIGEKAYIKVDIIPNKICIYSQGKIKGNYATSFEEAIILTNIGNPSIENLLEDVHPRIAEEVENNLREKSYYLQTKLSNSKSKFSSSLVYNSITEDNFNIVPPEYISEALDSLK